MMIAPAGKLRTPQRKKLFLAAYREVGIITKAAEVAGISRRTHYKWLEADKDYAKQFSEATEDAADAMESEAWRRAMQGTEKPVFYKGKQCGSIQEFSDVLLIFMLKGARPEKYRERVEHMGGIDTKKTARVVEEDDWYGNITQRTTGNGKPPKTSAPPDPNTN